MVDENTSDWNQQQDFSTIFFELAKFCRLYQTQGRLETWYSFIISKVSHAAGILTEPEFEQVISMVSEMTRARDNTLNCKPHEKQKNDRLLASSLFMNEAKLDRVINSKMPFLNIRKQSDIEGF